MRASDDVLEMGTTDDDDDDDDDNGVVVWAYRFYDHDIYTSWKREGCFLLVCVQIERKKMGSIGVEQSDAATWYVEWAGK